MGGQSKGQLDTAPHLEADIKKFVSHTNNQLNKIIQYNKNKENICYVDTLDEKGECIYFRINYNMEDET